MYTTQIIADVMKMMRLTLVYTVIRRQQLGKVLPVMGCQ